MNIAKKIYIFGDSLMKRIILSEEDRYIFLKDDNFEKMEQEFNLKIINKAKFGCTITKGAEILKKTIKQDPLADFAILEFGGNDCDYDWLEIAKEPLKNHQPKTLLNNFKETYSLIINFLREHKIEPLLMSLPPIQSQHYFDWVAPSKEQKEGVFSWLKGDIERIHRAQELYSYVATNLAFEMKCLLIDLRISFLKQEYLPQFYCKDGIHPNQKGHKLIFETCQNFAREYFKRSEF